MIADLPAGDFFNNIGQNLPSNHAKSGVCLLRNSGHV